jgi:hypothetical protein
VNVHGLRTVLTLVSADASPTYITLTLRGKFSTISYRTSIQPYKSSTRALDHLNRAMDMDTDCPELPVRKYFEAVEDMDLPSKAQKLQARPTSLSPFERLPLELRQQIYCYLGVPIARKFTYGRYLSDVTGTISRYTFNHWDDNATRMTGSKYGYSGVTYKGYYTSSDDGNRFHGLSFFNVSLEIIKFDLH